MAPKITHAHLASLAGVLASASVAISHPNSEYIQPSGVYDRADDIGRGRRWMEECLSDRRQLYIETRLELEAFESLVSHLRSHGVSDSKWVMVEEKLITFLYICGHGVAWRNARYRCGHSLDTISKLVIVRTGVYMSSCLQVPVISMRCLIV